MRATTAADLARRLRKGTGDPVAVAEDVFARIEAHGDPAIFIAPLKERALTEAKAARKRLKAGTPASLLDGVPIGWKDLFDLEGHVTTAGSIVLKNDPPAQADAALVAAGKRAASFQSARST